MNDIPPQPVCFEPVLVPKPWGGRRLESLLGRRLPPGELVGESWEIADLPNGRSRVADGPLAGQTPGELVQRWGVDLLGPAHSPRQPFPLLIKFLDARENLSVQTHPRPRGAPGPTAPEKHECWYILHADPGAQLYIGLRDGVGPADVASAMGSRALVELLRTWSPQPGQCYFLPSGTLHALGAGVVVAEIQTPSDATYRAYDWDRVDAAGRSRELHLREALENTRYDVRAEDVLPAAAARPIALGQATRLVACPAFDVFRWDAPRAAGLPIHRGLLRAWIVLNGPLRIDHPLCSQPLERGQVWLLPAAFGECVVDAPAGAAWIEARVPGRASP